MHVYEYVHVYVYVYVHMLVYVYAHAYLTWGERAAHKGGKLYREIR